MLKDLDKEVTDVNVRVRRANNNVEKLIHAANGFFEEVNGKVISCVLLLFV